MAMTQLPAVTPPAAGAPADLPPTHPEEMKAVYDVRIGRFITLQGSARITPAGMICTGIAVTALLFGVAAIVKARR